MCRTYSSFSRAGTRSGTGLQVWGSTSSAFMRDSDQLPDNLSTFNCRLSVVATKPNQDRTYTALDIGSRFETPRVLAALASVPPHIVIQTTAAFLSSPEYFPNSTNLLEFSQFGIYRRAAQRIWQRNRTTSRLDMLPYCFASLVNAKI